MASPNKDLSTPNGKAPKRFGLTDQLRKMATPLRSNALRQLVMGSLPSFSRNVGESTPQVKPVKSNGQNDIGGWMSSIRMRAKAALQQDDSFEEETNLEIERSRREQELADPDSPPPSSSFDQLGRILDSQSKKRALSSISHIETPSEKRQKIIKVCDLYYYKKMLTILGF